MIVSWNTTNACNLYCEHCYRGSGSKSSDELSTSEAKELLNQIASTGFRIMIFSGGEPLMRSDIFELISHASKLKLIPVLGSNGTLITREVAKNLKSAGALGVGISLDSLDPNKHDKFRSSVGAWKSAVEGMKNCLAMNLPFQIHTTVLQWNKNELEALTEFAIKIGAKAHHFFFLVPTGRAKTIEEQSLQAEDYEKILNRIMKKQLEVSIEIKPTCAPQFIRIAEQLGVKTKFGRGCLAGLSYCIINPQGKVQPCAYLKIELGDVRKVSFNEIWKDNRTLRILRTLNYSGNCGVCNYKKKCGGCRARAACYNFGNFMSGEPWCNYVNFFENF